MRRRDLLSALGVGGGFLPSLVSHRALAAAPVKRLVIMISPHQVMPSAFVMRQGNPAQTAFTYNLATTPDAQWSRVLAPLVAYKDRLTVIEGLSLYTGIPAQFEVNGHNASYVNLLTAAGIERDREKFSLGPSVDQVIAQLTAPVGKLPSLELGFQPPIGGWVNQAADQKPPIIGSPEQAFARLFPGSGGAGSIPLDARRLRIRAARPSILNFTRAEYQHVMPNLPQAERDKLGHHIELLRDLEARLLAVGELADCQAPAGEYPDYVGATAARFELFAKLTAAALACDITRVVTLQINELRNYEFDAPAGSLHEDFAHQAHLDDAAASYMANYNHGYGKMFARLLDLLSGYRDGNGSLLENCVVVWMSEHGLTREPHQVVEQPVVLAGGGAAGLSLGRYISVPRNTPHPMLGRKQLVGTPHSHFLVSLLQAMGVARNTFGMPEVRTAEGEIVKLGGPLPELA